MKLTVQAWLYVSRAGRPRPIGYPMGDGIEMGPVISAESKQRIESLIAKGEREGAKVLVDGRGKQVQDYEDGFFVFPTILDNVPPEGEIAKTEIFGPVLSLMHAKTLDDAIQMVNARSYGNMACLFTSDGASARRFKTEVQAGNVGINVGVAAHTRQNIDIALGIERDRIGCKVRKAYGPD